MGIIHDDAANVPSVSNLAAPEFLPDYPSAEELETDPETGYRWAMDPALPPDYERSDSLVAYEGTKEKSKPQRGTTIIDAHNLERIDAFINTVPGRYGVKALRFIGNRRMGTVVLGDWQDDYARAPAVHSMSIKGQFLLTSKKLF